MEQVDWIRIHINSYTKLKFLPSWPSTKEKAPLTLTIWFEMWEQVRLGRSTRRMRTRCMIDDVHTQFFVFPRVLCLSIKHVRDNPKLSIGKCKCLMRPRSIDKFFSRAVDPAQQFTYLLIIEWKKKRRHEFWLFFLSFIVQNISNGRWCENNCRLTSRTMQWVD